MEEDRTGVAARIAVAPAVAVLVASLVVMIAVVGTSHGHPNHGDDESMLGETTREHTIVGEDQQDVNDPRGDPESFSLLRIGPGEPYVVREELARAREGRENRRGSLVYLGHLTDFQLADAQSPARVEFLDPQGGPFTSAWRPQETLVPHQVELAIRQMNQFPRSPIPQGDGSRAELANAVMTGDLADNQQLNETRWVLELLQGGTFENGQRTSSTIDTNSGSSDVGAYPEACQLAVQLGLLDPDDADRYVGVQNYDDYPAGSTAADRRGFYDPNQPEGQYSNWPVYEGLVDKAQEPFEVEGLNVPFYVAFGNHDMLVQGNQWANAVFDQIARGCIKVFPAPGAEQFLEDLLGTGLSASDPRLMGAALELSGEPPLADLRRAARQQEMRQREGPGEGDEGADAAPLQLEDLDDLRDFETFVPPDDDRRFVDRREFKTIFDNGVQADGHGFGLVDPVELEASDGAASYYEFSPDDGIRYIVLDTVSYGGQFPLSSAGNIDHPQFQWLRRTLEDAQERDELILVFGHHGLTSLDSPVPHEAAPPCRDPATGEDQQHIVGPGCDRDPRDSRKPGTPSPHQGSDLEELLLEFPNVVALIAGHSHNNRVNPVEREDGSGGFWEIKSPAIVDWPVQHRLVELMDNDDGTLSIFATMLNDAAAAQIAGPSGNGGPSLLQAESRFEYGAAEVEGFTTEDLASVGRTLAYNDPQVGPGGAQGVETDRNVELLLPDPRTAEPEPEPPDREREPPDRDRQPAADRDAAPTPAAPAAQPAESRGALPFTGLHVLLLLLLAAALLVAGRVARRLVR